MIITINFGSDVPGLACTYVRVKIASEHAETSFLANTCAGEAVCIYTCHADI